MTSSESMEVLFKIISKMSGPVEAKKFVSGTVYSAIDALLEEGIPLTAEAIETRLSKIATDFLEVSRKNSDAA